jgi:hypothetical protein
MIGNGTFHRHRPVLPQRASARHGDPGLQRNRLPKTALQMTLPIVSKPPLPIAIQRSYHADQAGRAAITSPGSERPW